MPSWQKPVRLLLFNRDLITVREAQSDDLRLNMNFRHLEFSLHSCCSSPHRNKTTSASDHHHTQHSDSILTAQYSAQVNIDLHVNFICFSVIDRRIFFGIYEKRNPFTTYSLGFICACESQAKSSSPVNPSQANNLSCIAVIGRRLSLFLLSLL